MNMEEARSRCWAEIDLDIIESNFDSARSICGSGVQVIPVLKGNAYGYGAAELSRALANKGASLFAVADYYEAVEVRHACGQDVLVLGRVGEPLLEDALREGLVLTVYNADAAQCASRAAQRLGKSARVHIKVDTGLHRLGFDAECEIEAVDALFHLPGLKIEGVFTHLALRTAEADAAQMARFQALIDALRSRGRDCGMVHAADSIGMVRYPDYRLDAVRIGAWLYGVTPNRCPCPEKCRMPLRFMSRIVQLRDVREGEYLGYDETHPLSRNSRIATISAGYADGYPRLNCLGAAMVHGKQAPVAGLVCMDQLTLDVTDIDGVKEGDEVTLLGDGITLDAMASWAGTNRNDLLTRLGRRVPRVYMRGDRIDHIESEGEPLFK